MKRLILIIALTLMLSTTSVYGFSDVNETDWFYNDILNLKHHKVINGYEDGTYRPHAEVTSAEALSMIMRATGIEAYPHKFGHWGSGVLLAASEKGIVDNYADFEFDEHATRGDVAEFASKAMGLDTKSRTPFSDTNNKHVVSLYENGIVTGVKQGDNYYYYENNNISRAELAAIVNRIISVRGNKENKVDYDIEEVVETSQALVSLSESDPSRVDSASNTYEDILNVFKYMGENDKLHHTFKINETNIELVKPNVTEAFRRIHRSYPEYNSFTPNIKWTLRSDGQITLNLYNNNIDSETIISQKKDFRIKADSELQKLIDSGIITKNMSEYDKAKVLYEWIINNTTYDYDYATQSYNGYGQISTGKAVCQGYTATYNYMLKRLGIQAQGIIGTTKETGELHMWTIAYLDGIRYHIDTTWGDGYTDKSDKISYEFFAISADKISKTHSWDTSYFGY